jgi:hypothetical protein
VLILSPFCISEMNIIIAALCMGIAVATATPTDILYRFQKWDFSSELLHNDVKETKIDSSVFESEEIDYLRVLARMPLEQFQVTAAPAARRYLSDLVTLYHSKYETTEEEYTHEAIEGAIVVQLNQLHARLNQLLGE